MKILSYNINQCSQEKLDAVIAMGADIMVLLECANKPLISIPDDYEMLWSGEDGLPNKGMAIIWKQKKCRIRKYEEWKHKYMQPLIVNDGDNRWFLLASWPTVYKTDKTYPQILLEALKEYTPLIQRYDTIVTGDFNCYIGQKGVSQKTGTFEQCITYMASLGLHSEYHKRTQEEFGKETCSTFHHHYDENRPFFLDYTFTNIPLFAYMIGGWERNISDHNAQIIVI